MEAFVQVRVNYFSSIKPLTTNALYHIETKRCQSIDWFLYDEKDWSLMG